MPKPSYAVLLVAYGAPDSLEDVEPYLLDVRGGRPTPATLVEELRNRYAAIGGRSPLLARSQAQAEALRAALGDEETLVYLGMRHWHPFIAETMGRIRHDGWTRIVVIPLAPHFSSLSVGAYQRCIDEANRGGGIDVALVQSWGDHPSFVAAVTEQVRGALSRFPMSDRNAVPVVFTAHSLPQRILANGDPYPQQLQATVNAVMEQLGDRPFELAYQSAGASQEPWLGPTAADVLTRLAAEGVQGVVLCPVGFVSDHLEVLYDVDIELQRLARELRVRLERTESLNSHPRLIATLVDLVRREAGRRGWS